MKTDHHGAVFGLAGWSGSGKTTLVEQVVSHLVGLAMTWPPSNMHIIILTQTSLAKTVLDTGRRGRVRCWFHQHSAQRCLANMRQVTNLICRNFCNSWPQQILCLLKGLKNTLLKKLKFFGPLWEAAALS